MAYTRYFHKPRPLPLLLSVGAMLLLFGLGIWQLQRLAWKEALIARIEEANQSAPLERLPDDADALQARRFYTVRLRGEYLPDIEFHLAARYFRSELGYSILTPFRLKDGRIVLVSRGWVPARLKEPETRSGTPAGPRTILAQIRTSNERNPFTPENQPEQNVWFGRDARAMGQSAGLDVLPITLDRIGEQHPEQFPVPSDGKIKLRNDHLGYAITWFGIGLAVCIIFLIYHRKKPGASA